MFKNSDTYGSRLNSYDCVKLIALGTMVIDHLGAFFWQDADWMRAIGRIAFPLFLFLVGYSAKWKNSFDFLLLTVAVIACAILTHHAVFSLNILATIAVTRYIMPFIVRYELNSRHLCLIFISSIIWFPLFLWCDYGTIAILFAVCGYLRRHKPDAAETRYFLSATIILHFIIEALEFQFSLPDFIVMLCSAASVLYILQNFYFRENALPSVTGITSTALKWASRNTLPLYAFHVMIFMILERILFPARLLHFHWI